MIITLIIYRNDAPTKMYSELGTINFAFMLSSNSLLVIIVMTLLITSIELRGTSNRIGNWKTADDTVIKIQQNSAKYTVQWMFWAKREIKRLGATAHTSCSYCLKSQSGKKLTAHQHNGNKSGNCMWDAIICYVKNLCTVEMQKLLIYNCFNLST